VSSGARKIYRLSMRGDQRLNHAIHMAAVTQIAHKHSDGQAYYQRKLAEGKTPAEARRATQKARATGERLCIQRGSLTPRTPALRTSHSRACHHPKPARTPRPKESASRTLPNRLTNKRDSFWREDVRRRFGRMLHMTDQDQSL